MEHHSQPQKACASFTHVVSQAAEQQLSSKVHTIEQHLPSLQKGCGCSLQQLPVSGSPQEKPLPQTAHSAMAIAAHVASHTESQQKGSMPHTSAQQARLLQVALSCGVQQFPAAAVPQAGSGHATEHCGIRFAVAAQKLSHSLEQQKISVAQTASQQALSLQRGVEWASQQGPAHISPQSN
jgi:hypothetical protein